MENRIKKVQLNTRVHSGIKESVDAVAERARLNHEVIITDAIRHFYGVETQESAHRRRLCREAFANLFRDKLPFDALAAV